MLERTGDPDLLACGAEGDAGAPAQPVGSRLEAPTPALPLVELTDQHKEPIGGGMDVGRQLGDVIA